MTYWEVEIMNKLASVLISIMMLVLINGLAIAASTSAKSSDIDILKQTTAYQMYDIVLYDSIAPTTGASISVSLYNVMGYDAIDFYAASSTGSVTTLNIQWKDSDNNNIGSGVTLTSGTPITVLHANAVLTLYTPDENVTSNITANIELAD